MLHINVSRELKSERGQVIHQYQIDCRTGECLGITGPSGSGKTSLLKMIAGLMTPGSGMIRDENEIWFEKSKGINQEPQKRNCGLLYQDPVLFPFLNLEENILYGSRNTESAEKYIRFLGLEKFKQSGISSLSGGQLKRAALAQLLTYNPRILLLDEPFAFLDENWMLKVADLLFHIQNLEHKTIIIVSHQKEFLANITDRMVTIDNGRVLNSGYFNHFSCRKSPAPTMYFSKPAG